MQEMIYSRFPPVDLLIGARWHSPPSLVYTKIAHILVLIVGPNKPVSAVRHLDARIPFFKHRGPERAPTVLLQSKNELAQ